MGTEKRKVYQKKKRKKKEKYKRMAKFLKAVNDSRERRKR